MGGVKAVSCRKQGHKTKPTTHLRQSYLAAPGPGVLLGLKSCSSFLFFDSWPLPLGQA